MPADTVAVMVQPTSPTWSGRVRPSRGLASILIIAGGALWGSTAWQFLSVDRVPMTWLLGLIALAVTLLIIATSAFDVRVDADGLTATSALRWPRFGVTPDEIAAITVTDINPLREFRGYGVRRSRTALGIVLRSGEAIDVTRTNGRRLVIVIDDARAAAEVLAAVRARSN